MRASAAVVVVCGASILLGAAPCRAVCPAHKLGLSVEAGPIGLRYYATERVELFTDSDEVDDLVVAEVVLSARATLARAEDVPKDDQGELVGVTDEGVCVLGTTVYASVMVDEVSIRQALALRKAMQAPP